MSLCYRNLQLSRDSLGASLRPRLGFVKIVQDDLDDRSYRRQTDDFIKAITTGRQPLVSVSDGYQALLISHAILESARTGETVALA